MLADKIARFFKIKRFQVPQQIERPLSMLKYVVLVLTLYFTWKIGDLVYEAYDPWAAYAHLGGDWAELTDKFLIGLIFLGVAVVGSIWIPNNFCRYFCPMGAFLSILAKLSPTKLHVAQSACTSCQKCSKICPVQIDICAQPKVTSSQCLSCGDCVVACPQADCLEPRVAGKFRIKWAVYGVAALVLFFAPVLISKQAGAWKSGTTAAEKVTDSSGVKNPYYIRGSMSLKEACDEFQIPLDRLLMAFNLPMDIDTNMSMKDVATAAGFSMRDLKEFAAQYVMQQNPGLTFEDSVEGRGHGGEGEH
jgi:ferredoxin